MNQDFSAGLEINTEKTEHMRFNINDSSDLILGSKPIKQVRDFKYLGSQIASTSSDVQQRVAKGWLAFWQLGKIWRASNVDLDLKINIFSAAVISILLYGCESWVMTPTIENQLNTFGTKCLRAILRISLLDHITNAELHRRSGLRPIADIARKRQLKWLGHSLRRSPDEPAKIFALYEPTPSQGRAKRGQTAHELLWTRHVKNSLARYRNGLSVEQIEELAKDRKSWTQIVAVCCPKTALDQ